MTVLLLAAGSLFAAETMYVAVKNAPVTEKASIKAAVITNLDYGTKVSVKQVKNKWCQVVTTDGKTGWIPEKSMSRNKVAQKKVSADAKEIALAGKGWSSAMEEAYSDAAGLDYSIIDSIENIVCDEDEIVNFIIEGKLKLGGLK